MDVIKLLMKEDIVPEKANRRIHAMAPGISIVVALSTFAVIPFGDKIELFGRTIQLQIANVNIGILYILALLSLGVYGITLFLLVYMALLSADGLLIVNILCLVV